MTEEEAVVIGKYLNKILEPGGKVLDIGSSTFLYRTKKKPHINEEIYQRVFDVQCSIISVDFKSGEGVDISGDVFLSETQEKINQENADVVLCNNLAEHVENKEHLLKIISDMGARYIIFSAPFDYPYHRDPIDNLYRPNENELAEAFEGYRIIDSQLVSSTTFAGALRKLNPLLVVTRIIKELVRVFYWIITLQVGHIRYSRIFWLRKPYTTTVALYTVK